METILSYIQQSKRKFEVTREAKGSVMFGQLQKSTTAASSTSEAERLQTKRKAEFFLKRKEKKRLKAFHIPKEGHVYNNYLPLNKLWNEYINSMAEIPLPHSALPARLIKADFHGAKITVDRSKCPTLIGITGILIQETENTMKLVTPDDKMKIIPKKGCVFSVNVLGKKVEIFGNHILYRSSERSVKKFKEKSTIAL